MSKKYISKATKYFVKTRANSRCEYRQCLDDFAPSPFNMEHITPISKGGTNDIDNLAFACGGCNFHKHNKTELFDEVSKSFVNLYNPRSQNWKEHFTWSEDFSQIKSLTPIGRITILTLKMNRQKLIFIRKILLKSKLHPPII